MQKQGNKENNKNYRAAIRQNLIRSEDGVSRFCAEQSTYSKKPCQTNLKKYKYSTIELENERIKSQAKNSFKGMDCMFMSQNFNRTYKNIFPGGSQMKQVKPGGDFNQQLQKYLYQDENKADGNLNSNLLNAIHQADSKGATSKQEENGILKYIPR